MSCLVLYPQILILGLMSTFCLETMSRKNSRKFWANEEYRWNWDLATLHRSISAAFSFFSIFRMPPPPSPNGEGKLHNKVKQTGSTLGLSKIRTAGSPLVHIIHRQGASLYPLIHSQCQMQV